MRRSLIAIVGAGQLGSRHLQALAALSGEADLFVVDPSEEALRLALGRYNAVAANAGHCLTTLRDVGALPSFLDLVIVATTADVRLEAIQKIMMHSSVKNWLLEKVLFQKLDDYHAAADLLCDNDAVWVNLSQRLWPFFLEIKQRFGNDPRLTLDVVGSNWGLGCNAVHNVDIASFLWDMEITHNALLDPEMIDSRRPKFKEFTGSLISSSTFGPCLRQTSYASGSLPFSFIAHHPTAQLVWRVQAGVLYEANDATGWEWTERQLTAPLQSVLTTKIASDILSGKQECGLPRFSQAATTHINTLEALIAGAERNGIRLGRTCPIT